MALTIYKPGQGYWTRMLSGVGAAVIVLTGVAWLVQQMAVIQSGNVRYIQAGAAAAIIVVLGGLIFWALNNPRVVDFMIATEAEMRKVSWPSLREIYASTWIVICGTLIMAVLMFTIDLVFAKFFLLIHVLEGGA